MDVVRYVCLHPGRRFDSEERKMWVEESKNMASTKSPSSYALMDLTSRSGSCRCPLSFPTSQTLQSYIRITASETVGLAINDIVETMFQDLFTDDTMLCLELDDTASMAEVPYQVGLCLVHVSDA